MNVEPALRLAANIVVPLILAALVYLLVMVNRGERRRVASEAPENSQSGQAGLSTEIPPIG